MSDSSVPPGHRRWSLGQLGAAIAGVLSLVFVGWEIRQNTTAIRGATYQAVADANVDWLQFMVENPELGELIQRWTAGDSTLTTSGTRRARSMQLMWWRTVENAHYQVLQSNLPAEAVSRWVPPDFLENPVIADWWRDSRRRFTPAFAEYVDEVAAGGTRQH